VSGALARIPVGVVVERAKAASQWADFTWRPVAVLPGVPDTTPWAPVREEADRTSFYAGATEIELYRTETGNYLDNLNSGAPSLWVALEPVDGNPPCSLFSVTADPTEGEALTEAGDKLVDKVPMPDSVREVVEAFIAEHHVEREAFFKRKRERANPEAMGRRGPIQERDK
jgi:hypothetical protein